MDHKKSRSELTKEAQKMEETEKNVWKDTEKIKEKTQMLRQMLDQMTVGTVDAETEVKQDVENTVNREVKEQQDLEQKDSEVAADKANEKSQGLDKSIQNTIGNIDQLKKNQQEFKQAKIEIKGLIDAQRNQEKDKVFQSDNKAKIDQDIDTHKKEMDKTQREINSERQREVNLGQGLEDWDSGATVDNRHAGTKRN